MSFFCILSLVSLQTLFEPLLNWFMNAPIDKTDMEWNQNTKFEHDPHMHKNKPFLTRKEKKAEFKKKNPRKMPLPPTNFHSLQALSSLTSLPIDHHSWPFYLAKPKLIQDYLADLPEKDRQQTKLLIDLAKQQWTCHRCHDFEDLTKIMNGFIRCHDCQQDFHQICVGMQVIASFI